MAFVSSSVCAESVCTGTGTSRSGVSSAPMGLEAITVTLVPVLPTASVMSRVSGACERIVYCRLCAAKPGAASWSMYRPRGRLSAVTEPSPAVATGRLVPAVGPYSVPRALLTARPCASCTVRRRVPVVAGWAEADTATPSTAPVSVDRRTNDRCCGMLMDPLTRRGRTPACSACRARPLRAGEQRHW